MENTVSNYERVGIDDMKKNYPDEWILLGNPEMNEQEQKVLSGVVLCHNRDKKELCHLGPPLVKNYETTALFFNRVTPRGVSRQIGILRTVSHDIQI